MTKDLVAMGAICAAFLAAAACGSSNGSTGSTGNPAASATILDPKLPYDSMTYGQWGGAWWKWILEMPGPNFPTDDATGAYCALGQSGEVFFLAGSLSPDGTWGTPVRTCTVPAGRRLFFPLVQWFADNAGVPVAQQQSDAQLEEQESLVARSVSMLALDIDGRSYGADIDAFEPFLTRWSEFSYTVPSTSHNFFETYERSPFAGSCPRSFAGGYWIMLAPMPAGAHTVHFSAHMVSSYLGPAFLQDVTYNLTVQ